MPPNEAFCPRTNRMIETVPSVLRGLPPFEVVATDLLTRAKSGEEAAITVFKWGLARFEGRPVADVDPEALRLDESRAVVARRAGFPSWRELALFIHRVDSEAPLRRFELAADAVVGGKVDELAKLIESDPTLVQERSRREHRSTLLHYVGANGVELDRQLTPPNIVDVARTLLDAGADVNAEAAMYGGGCDALTLVVTSTHPAEAGVQAPLACLLVERGARLEAKDRESKSALEVALASGYSDTARALANLGANVATVEAAAALGRIDALEAHFSSADANERQAAVALAAQHGEVGALRWLLDAGEDPGRFNPDGYHAHSTPLHQAALAGHSDVVELLVERGARTDIEDKIYGGTPVGWAKRAGHEDVVRLLDAR